MGARVKESMSHSCRSKRQLADDETVSIFSKEGVSVHKEEDVLITVKNEPILIRVRDEQGRYCIPLQQHKGQWKPRHASKKARQTLRKAVSVYDLPSTEQAIKCTQYAATQSKPPTGSRQSKQATMWVGLLLTVKNVTKYYPETTETQKGHLNQTRKNVRLTKPKPFKTANTTQLVGKKVQDIHTQVYKVRDTVLTDQTGQFPTQSRSGNKYIMVMVDIKRQRNISRTIKKSERCRITQGIHKFDDKAQQSRHIFPKKHVLDNEILQAMKDYVRDKYKMTVELVPPGCHRRNAAKEDAGPGGMGRKAKQVRNKRNRQNRAKQGGTRQNRGGKDWIGAEQKGYLGDHFGKRFVLSDGRNTAEQGRTKAEQGGTKPNMAEQAEQGKTKAEMFRPSLCPRPVSSRHSR
eukprot:scaffold61634_cov36-Cyclotella_meneghiniana.AAC.2